MLDDWFSRVVTASATARVPVDAGVTAPGPGQEHLPDEHRQLLSRTNGLLLYDGYFRVFGAAEGGLVPTIESWNLPAMWKFAWPGMSLDDFICFGDTSWGDQYAYRRSLLEAGREDVFFLDALRMVPRRISGDFGDFARRYLVRNATEPFDSMVRHARESLGSLAPDVHLTLSPHVLLGGEEVVDNIVKMRDVEVMILNGDLWTQLSEAEPEAEVEGLDVWQDDSLRQRIRVRWSGPKRTAK